MKKISFLLAFTVIIFGAFAQVQRKVKTIAPVDSATAVISDNRGEEKGGKLKMMRELNLTKEQKGKLKELRQAGKQKKEAIENDDTLKAEEKEAKLKELRKEQLKNTMSILTPEQKAKLIKMRKDKKDGDLEEAVEMN